MNKKSNRKKLHPRDYSIDFTEAVLLGSGKGIMYLFLLSWIMLTGFMQDSTTNRNEMSDSSDTTQADWIHLFNGNNLEGWQIFGGNKNFIVENGAIVGITKMNAPSGFLATKKKYDDFILEADFKIDDGINSGIQIRSDTLKEDVTTEYLTGRLEKKEMTFRQGRFGGYQIEFDPSNRAWTGGFYEEAGRGWIQPLNNNEEARKAFKNNQWNHLRIKANGNHIEAWVNGIKTCNVKDDKSETGYIALQLHSAHKKEQIDKKVRLKNVKIKEL